MVKFSLTLPPSPITGDQEINQSLPWYDLDRELILTNESKVIAREDIRDLNSDMTVRELEVVGQDHRRGDAIVPEGDDPNGVCDVHWFA